jgi:hypothetical protein
MVKCPNCQAEVAPDSAFCAECGSKLDAKPVPQGASPGADPDPSARPRTGKETILLPAASVTPPTTRLPEAGSAPTAGLPGNQPAAGSPGEARTIIAPPAAPGGAPTEDKTIISGAPPIVPSAPASSSQGAGGLWSESYKQPVPQSGGQIYPAPTQPATKSSNSRVLLIVALVAGLGFLTLIALGIGLVMFVRDRSTSTTPTAPARPTSAANPTALPTGTFGTTLLEDDFENPRRSSLTTVEDEDMTAAFADGAYSVNVKTPSLIVWRPFDGSYDDAAVEVDTILEGPPESSAVLLFRYQDDQNFYMFQVAGDGTYALTVYEADEPITLIDWTESTEIRGTGEVNRLRVETEGSLIRLFVNDQLLEEIDDATFDNGEMALAVSTADDGDATVTFDNLIVRGAR